jgi:hypothetical protein
VTKIARDPSGAAHDGPFPRRAGTRHVRKVTTLAPLAASTDLFVRYDIDAPSSRPTTCIFVFAAPTRNPSVVPLCRITDGKRRLRVPGHQPGAVTHGTRIAYSRTVDSRRQILVMNADGTKTVTITKNDCDHEDPVVARECGWRSCRTAMATHATTRTSGTSTR